MEKITCDIINDLLPLYYDDVCTQDSRRLVENHLHDCADCRRMLKELQAECLIAQEQELQEEAVLQKIASRWKKSVLKSYVKGLLAASCTLLLLYASIWGLTRFPVITIPSDAVDAEAEISGNNFIVHMRITAGYTSTSMDMYTTDDGKLFLYFKRGLIPRKSGNGTIPDEIYSASLDTASESGQMVRIREIYYGTEAEHKLLWKE